ncbi:MAG: helix-turn-helix transcriptional regulator [Deltaproteobacteria bacterium]
MTRPDPTPRYLELIDQLGRAIDRPRGWRRRAAEQLGIDESTLSKIVAGKRVVGWELAERAVERLKLPNDYFVPRAPEIQLPEPPGKSRRQRREISTILIDRLEGGTATVKDVFALAKAVAEDPAVLEARSILASKPPKTQQQIGALFLSASKLLAALRERESPSK